MAEPKHLKHSQHKPIQADWQSILRRSIQTICDELANGDQPDPTHHHYSRYHFLRQFRRYAGETPGAMLKRLKLEKGIYLLRMSSLRIIDIAIECGYESQEAFAKEFKRSMGLSPSQLRTLPHWSGGLHSPLDIHFDPMGLQKEWIAWQQKGEPAPMMKIATLQPYHVLTLSGEGNYWNMPKTWQRLMGIIKEGDIGPSIQGYLSLFHDHHASVPDDQKRWEVGLIVPDKKTTSPDLKRSTLPGGLYAIYVHFGCCEEIGPAWDAWKNQWLSESPYEIDTDRPSLEWYQNNPQILAPELHLTFLCDPIKKKAT